MSKPRFLSFVWWNLHNFAHHDAGRISDRRWPKSPAHYKAKRDRIVAAVQEACDGASPDLLAVCEITRDAAEDLASRLPGTFDVSVVPPYPRDDGFQVAVLFRSGPSWTAEAPLIPADHEDVTTETRPMLPVHFACNEHLIRFVACHWTAFGEKSSDVARQRLADVLRRDTQAFLEPEVPRPRISRHVVILGDLNEEPMSEIFNTRLIGRRDRESSHTRHWRDEEVRRVRLYNTAWRFLGEQVPHGSTGPLATGAAGTWYKGPHDWRTFDHVLVSCGLLGGGPPYLDETQTRVVSLPTLLDEDNLPRPFEPGSSRGVSDHLPIVGRIVLPEA